MPTYAYRCEHCGHASDEWLKISEATAERTCPVCGHATYRKQLTAPAFQLKGSGWYVTDFRNGSGGKKSDGAKDSKESGGEAKGDGAAEPKGESKSESKSESKGESKDESKDAAKSSSDSPAPAPAPTPAPDKST